jgi:hypothetical protein
VVGHPQGVIGSFSYYLLVILFFNIFPLIMEFTEDKTKSMKGISRCGGSWEQCGWIP